MINIILLIYIDNHNYCINAFNKISVDFGITGNKIDLKFPVKKLERTDSAINKRFQLINFSYAQYKFSFFYYSETYSCIAKATDLNQRVIITVDCPTCITLIKLLPITISPLKSCCLCTINSPIHWFSYLFKYLNDILTENKLTVRCSGWLVVVFLVLQNSSFFVFFFFFFFLLFHL